ncbi:hypothetical protein LOD99_6353 [Oopsacas minuta]|uniref:Uncharacterized protein n=1 Tax=Oopsacas minuta TaxID=111878 RepID=A0AAV7JNE5_9METZ|nr:hypothetical protein LOD99_6353 [Oopsacas minuta]
MASKLETNFELFLTLVKKDEVFLDNLVPICEQAIEEMRRDIALQCLDFYFSRCGHKTQYLQRAYNCKALLSVPQSIYDYDGLIEMGDNFLKALELFQANTM